MDRSKYIAWTPDQQPQQRLYPVVDLPYRPESFKGHYNPELCMDYQAEKELPVEYRPKQMPRSAQYLGTAEWAWSPMNNRLDAYHISTNRQRSHWILWSYWPDDNEWIWKWKSTLMAYGTKKGVDKKTASTC